MKGNLWTVIVLVVVIALLLPGINLAFSESLEENNVEAETVTLEFEEQVPVSAADYATSFDEDVTVADSGTGSELTEGEDYEWNSSDGTITALDESYDNEDVDIDYTYHAPTETTRDIEGLLAWVTPLLTYGLFLLVTLGAALGLASVID